MRNILFICFLYFFYNSFSQEYKFHHYGLKEGLNPFVNCIEQSNDGDLIVGTGEGLAIFNGLSFKMYNSNDSLAEDFVSSCFKDTDGKIWLGHKNEGEGFWVSLENLEKWF